MWQSTRSNMTAGDYMLQQQKYDLGRNYMSYEHSTYGPAYDEKMPCFGVFPSRLDKNTLSNNPVDIETLLLRPCTTKPSIPALDIQPELKTIDGINFFERLPLFIPQPLVIETKQRPFPI